MIITLKETDPGTTLVLQINKVDTLTGVGWSVLTPQGRTVLIKSSVAGWQAEDEQQIGPEFWQLLGDEIDCKLYGGEPASGNEAEPVRRRRTRLMKLL